MVFVDRQRSDEDLEQWLADHGQWGHSRVAALNLRNEIAGFIYSERITNGIDTNGDEIPSDQQKANNLIIEAYKQPENVAAVERIINLRTRFGRNGNGQT